MRLLKWPKLVVIDNKTCFVQLQKNTIVVQNQGLKPLTPNSLNSRIKVAKFIKTVSELLTSNPLAIIYPIISNEINKRRV